MPHFSELKPHKMTQKVSKIYRSHGTLMNHACLCVKDMSGAPTSGMVRWAVVRASRHPSGQPDLASLRPCYHWEHPGLWVHSPRWAPCTPFWG